MPRATHHDRGDSTCAECFEEWPCRVAEGKTKLSALEEERQDVMTQRLLEESLVRIEKEKFINAVLASRGIKLEWTRFAVGKMIDISVMFEICRLLDDSGIATAYVDRVASSDSA